MTQLKSLEKLNIPTNIKNDIETTVISLLDGFSENIARIILFGSYSDNSYQTDSDIDIAVILNELPPLKKRRYYYEQAAETDTDVDLLFCTEEQLNCGNYVYKHIKSKGKLLYEQL